MYFDDNNLKSKNSQLYFDSLCRGKKRRKTTKINQKNQSNGSKINNKLDNKCALKFQRKTKKQLTIGPLSSTLESTISSSRRLIEVENSNLPSEIRQKITIKSKKLLQPADDDMKFVFDILFNKNFNNQSNNNSSIKTSYYNKYSKETIESNYNNSNNNYDFNAIKKYLVKIQKKYNINGNAVLYNNRYQSKRKSLTGEVMDSYHLQKLEDLIARYSLIIFLFIRCGNSKEAKDIFLLMLKENMDRINNVEKKISSKYLIVNRKINIYRDVPKITYRLSKIYSFIIKYSQLFNLTNYRNIFIYKYFQILFLNYRFFIIKGMSRGFSGETRNQLKYWLSYCFHNCSYYCLYNYVPLKAPILFNYNIIHIYNNFEEISLTDLEKSLLIKTAFNEGLLYYINGQKDEALLSLNHAKEKIITYSEDYYDDFNLNNKKKDIVNMFKKHVKENVIEINETKKIRKKSTINPFKIKFTEEPNKNDDKNKKIKIIPNINSDVRLFNQNDVSLIANDANGKKSNDLTNAPKNKYEELKANIYKGFKKDKISISDIELLVQLGKDKGLLKEEASSGTKGLDFLFKYKESFSAIKKKITLPKGFRGSHIDFHTNMKIKDFFIPEKYKNPLLRKIELFMGLIELDKKNYEAAYEHVLKVLYILFLLKLSNNNYNIEFFNKQKIEINDYFRLIEDSYEKEITNKQILDQSSSKSILTANDRKSLSNIYNLNNSLK